MKAILVRNIIVAIMGLLLKSIAISNGTSGSGALPSGGLQSLTARQLILSCI
jgi:hypothetical protein